MDAAGVVDDLDVVLDAGVDADTGEGEEDAVSGIEPAMTMSSAARRAPRREPCGGERQGEAVRRVMFMGSSEAFF